jgi:hypothetical protein
MTPKLTTSDAATSEKLVTVDEDLTREPHAATFRTASVPVLYGAPPDGASVQDVRKYWLAGRSSIEHAFDRHADFVVGDEVALNDLGGSIRSRDRYL